MDDTLKRLLDAEKRAQTLVDDALREQENLLEKARQEARAAEEHFDATMRELRGSLNDGAREEAERTIAEMERRFNERGEQLEALAQKYRADAVAAAVAIVTDPERS